MNLLFFMQNLSSFARNTTPLSLSPSLSLSVSLFTNIFPLRKKLNPSNSTATSHMQKKKKKRKKWSGTDYSVAIFLVQKARRPVPFSHRARAAYSRQCQRRLHHRARSATLKKSSRGGRSSLSLFLPCRRRRRRRCVLSNYRVLRVAYKE